MTRNFRALTEARWAEGKYLCVGLDPDPGKIPSRVHLYGFLRGVVDATAPYVAAFKPNIAFFEGIYLELFPNPEAEFTGLAALRGICRYIREKYPDIPIILDGKRGDIGNSNRGYAKAFFELYGADAITVPPYLGEESLTPFLEVPGKYVFVLCRTSNPGAGEFQDMVVKVDRSDPGGLENSMLLYQYVALRTSHFWTHKNVGLVVGATYPAELEAVRAIVGDEVPILIPGIGKQGGDLELAVRNGAGGGHAFIINASSSVLYASSGGDYAEAAGTEAKRLHDEIQRIMMAYSRR